MTVSSTTNRKTYTGNGVTTSFSTSPVVFFDTSDLTVYVVTTATGVSETLVENTDYTVTGGDGAVGTVNLAGGSSPYGAPASTQTLVIVREVPATQETDFANNDTSDAEVVEDALDRLTMLAQQNATKIVRALRQPDEDPTDIGDLPNSVDRASLYLAFDANGDPVATAGTTSDLIATPFIETLLDDTTAAAARTTLGASATTPADDVFRVVGSADATKKVAIEVDTLTTGTTRTLTMQDANGTVGFINPGANDFRLSLTTALPVTTSDVTGATTIYCVPYKGKKIALYDGTIWREYTSAEFSLALGTLTSGKPYDVFCYANAGVPTLEFLAWTNDTSRATALAYQDGVLVKSGAPTRRYLGTFYTTSTTQTEDSAAKRFLWNYYHRVPRAMQVLEATDSWNYSTATWRQANNAAANQLDYVCGVAEDAVVAEGLCYIISSAATVRYVGSGFGVDSTTAPSGVFRRTSCSNGSITGITFGYRGLPGVGRHYLAWLERGDGSDTQTWYGDNGEPTVRQAGITGQVMS